MDDFEEICVFDAGRRAPVWMPAYDAGSVLLLDILPGDLGNTQAWLEILVRRWELGSGRISPFLHRRYAFAPSWEGYLELSELLAHGEEGLELPRQSAAEPQQALAAGAESGPDASLFQAPEPACSSRLAACLLPLAGALLWLPNRWSEEPVEGWLLEQKHPLRLSADQSLFLQMSDQRVSLYDCETWQELSDFTFWPTDPDLNRILSTLPEYGFLPGGKLYMAWQELRGNSLEIFRLIETTGFEDPIELQRQILLEPGWVSRGVRERDGLLWSFEARLRAWTGAEPVPGLEIWADDCLKQHPGFPGPAVYGDPARLSQYDPVTGERVLTIPLTVPGSLVAIQADEDQAWLIGEQERLAPGQMAYGVWRFSYSSGRISELGRFVAEDAGPDGTPALANLRLQLPWLFVQGRSGRISVFRLENWEP